MSLRVTWPSPFADVLTGLPHRGGRNYAKTGGGGRWREAARNGSAGSDHRTRRGRADRRLSRTIPMKQTGRKAIHAAQPELRKSDPPSANRTAPDFAAAEVLWLFTRKCRTGLAQAPLLPEPVADRETDAREMAAIATHTHAYLLREPVMRCLVLFSHNSRSAGRWTA